MNSHREPTGPADEQVTLRGPAELVDALPYVLGFHPTDSIVMVALHGSSGRFGGRLRLGIPRASQEWPAVAKQLAECLVEGSERRGARPDGIVVFLCQDPPEGATGRQAMERLRPLAQRLRTACGTLDVPVYEALCISDGRYWSYCCPDARCCPPEGNPLGVPGTSAMAAAAAYAGVHVRGTLREMEARLTPWTAGDTAGQARALDAAGSAIVPRILDAQGRQQVAAETLALTEQLRRRLAEAETATGWAEADAADDRLISHEEAASVILGLQDRTTRDRAAECMEGPDAAPALRLWRALARRCVGGFAEHAAAPLTLAGWVAWSTGDEPGARVALGLALRADPGYLFARLLHQACNDGLDPEDLRICLRTERETREAAGERTARHDPGRPRGPRRRGRRVRLGGAGRTSRPSGSGAPKPPVTLRKKPGPAAAGPAAGSSRRRPGARAAGSRRGAQSGTQSGRRP